MIQWEMFQGLKFDNTSKWHMHKIESEMLKILWDCEIKVDS